jgi:hypothetical protein
MVNKTVNTFTIKVARSTRLSFASASIPSLFGVRHFTWPVGKWQHGSRLLQGWLYLLKFRPLSSPWPSLLLAKAKSKEYDFAETG